MIGIIDYNMGNIHSVRKALEAQGAKVVVTNNHAEIKRCTKLVLPGVGAFGDAMEELRTQDLVESIIEHIKDKKFFLGICLGMHLLFDSSEESPGSVGIKVLKGKVKKFQPREGLKVPHMGWNQLKVRRTDCPLLKGIVDDSSVYFCHSYYPDPEDRALIAASTEYGVEFGSILWHENVFVTQFHPEKSQIVGLKIVENFVKL